MATSPPQQDSPPVRRSRGRPRDPRVEGVVLGATRDLLVQHGFGRLTIAAVAEKAGVGKGTIYLRWPDKESLVVAALEDVWQPVPAPDTGSLRGDLTVIVTDIGAYHNGKGGKLFTSVVGEIGRYRELRKLWTRNVIEPWAVMMDSVFASAVERGEMRPGIDLDVAIESLMGPVVGICAVRGEKITPTQVDSIVDLYLHGVTP